MALSKLEVDNMLNNQFEKINRAFKPLNSGLESLAAKLSKVSTSARAGFGGFTDSANKALSTVNKLNDALDKHAEKVRKMPKMPSSPMPRGPQPSGSQPRAPQGGAPTGRGGGGRGRGPYFGGTSSGHMYAGGFGGIGGFGMLGAAYGIGSIARGFGSFDANLATLQAEAGLSKAQRKDVTGDILDIAGSTAFNKDEVSSMLVTMIRDGVKLKDALAEVPNVLKLAVAESTDLTTAWNATNTFVSGLNVPLTESVRLMDLMSNATSLSKLKIEQIQYIAGQSLSLFSQIKGFSEEGFLGITGILGPLFRPERIGTGLKQLSLLLPQAATGQLAGGKNDIFESWGVNITDAAGNLLDEVSVLKEFERVFAGMSGEARNVELARVFGTEAAPVFSALIGQSDKLKGNMQEIRKAGTLDAKYAVHAESLTHQMKLLTSAIDTLITKFVMFLNEGNAFGKIFGFLTEQATNFTHWMESNKDTIEVWWGGLQKAVKIGWKYCDVIAAVVIGVTAFKAFHAASAAVKGLDLAFHAFKANPYGLIIAGIAAGAYLIIKNWGPISAFFEKLWGGVTGATSDAWDSITSFASTSWNKIKEIFSRVKEEIRAPMQAMVNFVKEYWGKVWDIFKWTPTGLIVQGFLMLIDKIKEPLKKFFDGLKEMVKEFVNNIPGINISTSKVETKSSNIQQVSETSPRPLTIALPPVPKRTAKVEPTFYESRAAKPVTDAPIAKPKWGFDKFIDGLEKDSKARESFRKSFGMNLKTRGIVGKSRNIEDLYKIDDRALTNVREHFEDTAEKEFFSGLQTYAEQSFSHIDSTLTDAQRSLREKVFATQKLIQEDKAKWQKLMDSGAFDKLSASLTLAGTRAANKEVYELLMGALSSGGAAGLGMKEKRDEVPAVLKSLEGKISTKQFEQVTSLFKTLSESAAFAPGMQRALSIDRLVDVNKQALSRAELQRGHKLLSEIMNSSDTVTQAKRHLSEIDAGLLQSAFEQLKPFADQLPQMRRLLARESMLTGEPTGTKMNVFEFPTLTKEQHVELTSVFRSHFLSLIDVNSGQLAVLKYIAGVLGGGNFAKALGTGPVIKQQYGTLDDDYLSDRDLQVQNATQRKIDQLIENVRLAENQTPQSKQITATGDHVVKSSDFDRAVFNIPISLYGVGEINQEVIDRLKSEVRKEIEATLRESNF